MKTERLYLKLRQAIEEAPRIPPCQTTDPDLWYGDSGEDRISYQIAKQLCSQCPVQNICLEYALEANEFEGVWGGLSPKERGKMRAAQERAKTRRPNYKEMI